jgi:hypothetical protein
VLIPARLHTPLLNQKRSRSAIYDNQATTIPDCWSATNLLTILPYTPMATAVLPCYYPNGYSPPSDDIEYVPCDYSNSGTRMCCATNRPNPSGGNFSNGLTADKCLENGLCMNSGYHADGTHWTNYWRDMCTSNDWSAGGCLDVCTDEKVRRWT